MIRPRQCGWMAAKWVRLSGYGPPVPGHVQVPLQLLMERYDVRALTSGTAGAKRPHSPGSPLKMCVAGHLDAFRLPLNAIDIRVGQVFPRLKAKLRLKGAEDEGHQVAMSHDDQATHRSGDELLKDLELSILKTAKQHDAHTLYLLQTVPGIGKILSVVLLYEIYDIRRFPSGQDFTSYARLVKCSKESGGKRLGTSGKKIGNAHLKWAFSEAATLFLCNNPEGQKLLTRLEKKHDKGKALSILAHQLGRAVYLMLKRKTAFDMNLFLQS